MAASVIADVRWHALQVSPKTRWSFIEIRDSDGRIGVGEATLSHREQEMAQQCRAHAKALIARPPAGVDFSSARSGAAALPEFAVVSALDQAVWDLIAQQRGSSVGDALGPRRRDRVPVYANVNRGIDDRSPQGFARQARRAVDDGFDAVKIAPFDDVDLYGDSSKAMDGTLLDTALARIAAVRDAIGGAVDLMVDCHWRLNRAVAESVIDAVDAYRLYWLECPVPERPEFLEVLRALRNRANARGVRLAGCEEMSLLEGFMPFLRAGTYDVMMPDVKYVGGLREMLDVAGALHRHGVGFSPHNPSGPVGHAASLQICGATAHVERLEMQYRETPFFDSLVSKSPSHEVTGDVEVPRLPGLGVRLDPSVVCALGH